MTGVDPLAGFHPAVSTWFEQTFSAPTECQLRAWSAIRAGSHTLVAAPTGSGKTLAAFLCAIDELLREALSDGGLEDTVRVLYVSPLKALSNDIHLNLQLPMEGIREVLPGRGQSGSLIRAAVRTGDTPASERAQMRRQPPHILVTTPESLFNLLTSPSGRAALQGVRTVIVDEIHALVGNKRGAHLALSLERLRELTATAPVRIGLSATLRPVEMVANFLVGNARDPRRVVDIGHQKQRDLALELPPSPLQAVMSAEQWAENYDRLANLVDRHRTTLVFVNTRRLAERVARHLAERIGEDSVTAHHGSLAREHRLVAEQRLKTGQLKVLVATASLELGIDIGDIDLICQLGSPRSIAIFLQRVGRSGHSVGATPKARLFPCTRDDLVECVALLDGVRRDELETLRFIDPAIDVMAQQIVAESAMTEQSLDQMTMVFQRAWPYRELTPQQMQPVVEMLADGFATRRGRRGALIHYDGVNRKLRGRRGAALTALTNGGTIPDQFDYDVLLEPEGLKVGTLNEDFAFESLPGDIFQLGNTSYRIERVERSVVRVSDARGAPPNIPFWFGEAPGRSDELSNAVSRLRSEFEDCYARGNEAVDGWLASLEIGSAAFDQLRDYFETSLLALGKLPTRQQIVFERFFDESGDTHLVIHSPFGSRINRAWGLALRKRFCRRFNFELQAAAMEDSIVLSLSATHSFPLEEVAAYLKHDNVADVLTQALLAAPVFASRWRWVATTALAVRRNRNGRRVAPQLQRMDAEDLVAVVFPDQLACQENLAGDREIPDHPLVQQAIGDCLHEAMDIDGLRELLLSIESGRIAIETRDLALPSPLAQEVLTARPYAFLDDAPAEERRTSAVQTRSFLDPDTARRLGRLDEEAIRQVREQAWPTMRDADELYDALLLSSGLWAQELPRQHGRDLIQQLVADGRAVPIDAKGERRWVATERLCQWSLIQPDSGAVAMAVSPQGRFPARDLDEAVREIVRSRLECSGPIDVSSLAHFLGLEQGPIQTALAALEVEGFAMRGHYSGQDLEWCERGLLARINRLTVDRLRRQIEPVSAAQFMAFLCVWQGLAATADAETGLMRVMEQLEGFAAPAAVWERDLLSVRLTEYHPGLLDRLCLTGRLSWDRVAARDERADRDRPRRISRTTLIRFAPRRDLPLWQEDIDEVQRSELSPASYRLLDAFLEQGALYLDELKDQLRLDDNALRRSLRELVLAGRVCSDSLTGLTALLANDEDRGLESGRWFLVRRRAAGEGERIEHQAKVLLRRYGVVFPKLLQRETGFAPWRILLGEFRRLEARGEIRGGRFVAGFSGEQFALPEAVSELRRQKRRQNGSELITIAASDPLNLVGVVLPGERIARHSRERLVLRDGVLLAVEYNGDLRFVAPCDASEQWEIRNDLLSSVPAPQSLN